MQNEINKPVKKFLYEAGEIASFAGRFFREGFTPPYELNELLHQSFVIGFYSLPLVSVTAFVLGMVLILQSRPSMMEFGAGSYLPAMAAISIIREIGPLVTGLICAGKIGSGISAELGSMKVTEQIDAMEVSGTNPFKFLVASRIAAATLMIPLLTIYADAISLGGAFVGANVKDSVNIYLYLDKVFDSLKFGDVFPALIKTFFFGFSIGLIGCAKGYYSRKGTEGVGRATNAAVIVSMLSVIVIDMMATQVSVILGLL